MRPWDDHHDLEKAEPNQRNPQLTTKRQLLNEMSRKEAQIVTCKAAIKCRRKCLHKKSSNMAENTVDCGLQIGEGF